MEPEGSLPSSQEAATSPYPELDTYSPHPSNPSLLTSILILFFHRRLGSPTHATCSVHLILPSSITLVKKLLNT
jgi:hypothetical protein